MVSLISIKTFILYLLWLRKVNQSLPTSRKLVPMYYKDALIVFCLLAFVFNYFFQGGGSNGNSRFDLIFAIIQEGRLTIDDFQLQNATYTGDKAIFNVTFIQINQLARQLLAQSYMFHFTG